MTVTEAIENKVAGGGFNDPAWLSELDVLFARLYFDALVAALSGGSCPECWKAMFSVRYQAKIARIQFALAGMNTHINHDLPIAIVSTCQATKVSLRSFLVKVFSQYEWSVLNPLRRRDRTILR